MNDESTAYQALSKSWKEMSLSLGRRRKPWVEPATTPFRGQAEGLVQETKKDKSQKQRARRGE